LFLYLFDPDQRVVQLTRAILDRSQLQPYVRLLTSNILTMGPPKKYQLIPVLNSSDFGRFLHYVVPLIQSPDSVIAGTAMRVLGRKLKGSLNDLLPIDDNMPNWESEVYFVTSLLSQDKNAGLSSLMIMAERHPTRLDSVEFYSACIAGANNNSFL